VIVDDRGQYVEPIVTPTRRELEILKVLWELGPSTVRAVHEHYFQVRGFAFNTVQTMLRLMADEKKGLVSAQLVGRTFVYTARYSRDQCAARFLDHVFDGAAAEMVQSLLRSEDISAEELEQMQAMIDEARLRNGRRRSGRGGAT
jgi:BlaI family transcriptional regulator, penicillinase repressor